MYELVDKLQDMDGEQCSPLYSPCLSCRLSTNSYMEELRLFGPALEGLMFLLVHRVEDGHR